MFPSTRTTPCRSLLATTNLGHHPPWPPPTLVTVSFFHFGGEEGGRGRVGEGAEGGEGGRGEVGGGEGRRGGERRDEGWEEGRAKG